MNNEHVLSILRRLRKSIRSKWLQKRQSKQSHLLPESALTYQFQMITVF